MKISSSDQDPNYKVHHWLEFLTFVLLQKKGKGKHHNDRSLFSIDTPQILFDSQLCKIQQCSKPRWYVWKVSNLFFVEQIGKGKGPKGLAALKTDDRWAGDVGGQPGVPKHAAAAAAGKHVGKGGAGKGDAGKGKGKGKGI